MSAEVKAALEAAGEAARKALVRPGCCMEGTGCEVCPCHCASLAAAAAIASFLRALPEDVLFARMKGDEAAMLSVRFVDGAEDFDDLAAAVTAAAQEGGQPLPAPPGSAGDG